MISQNGSASTVELSIPMRAEYVSIARLTAAGVANRLGFDIDAIEDIKVSISEVCNRIINTQNNYSAGYCADCKLVFNLSVNCLGIDFYVEDMESVASFMPAGALSENSLNGGSGIDIIDMDSLNDDRREEEFYKDQLQLSIISLLMDEFVVNPSESCIVSMKKYVD